MQKLAAFFSWFIATGSGVGNIPFAPGTWGSLLAYPFAFYAFFFHGADGYAILCAILVAFCFAGYWATHYYIQRHGIQDPKEVIVDEIIGQLITLLAIAPLLEGIAHGGIRGIIMLGGAFVLFRLFDITKPWLVGWCDRHIKGALGVILDDVAAALYASASYYVLWYIALYFGFRP